MADKIEAHKMPGIAVQALAGEIVAALLADKNDGGYDLESGLFGPNFSTLVRRWAAAEWKAEAPTASNAEPIARIEFRRGEAGRENEMPRVVSCNWLPDGIYEVYLADPTGVQPCCGEYAKCRRPCTPRGRWLALATQPTASNAGERTPKDYAIEHAEYMATSAVHLIAAVNDLAKAEQENEDGIAEQSDVDAARDTLTERVSALRDGIYEFRKRRDRAALAQVPEQVAQDKIDAERYRLVRRGQHWSVIDGIGNVLRGEQLDKAVDDAIAINAMRRAARTSGEAAK